MLRLARVLLVAVVGRGVVDDEVAAGEEAVLAAGLLLGEDLYGGALLVKPARDLDEGRGRGRG